MPTGASAGLEETEGRRAGSGTLDELVDAAEDLFGRVATSLRMEGESTGEDLDGNGLGAGIGEDDDDDDNDEDDRGFNLADGAAQD